MMSFIQLTIPNLFRCIVVVVIASFFYGYFASTPAYAAACDKDDQITTAQKDSNGNNCFDSIYNEITEQYDSTLSIDDFTGAIKACESTSGNVLSDYHHATNQGNCVNAMLSCYHSVVDTRACVDKEALSYVASCSNNGIVGYGGDCGLDEAIDVANRNNPGDGPDDFDDNDAIKESRRNQFLDAQKVKCAEAAASQSTPSSRLSSQTECEKQDEELFNQCYSKLQGESAYLSEAQLGSFNDCIIRDAGNEDQCTRVGGKWSTDGQPNGQGVCVNPTPLGQEGEEKEPDSDAECAKKIPGTEECATITPITDRCGNARVNIVVCGEADGEDAFNNLLRIIIIILSIAVGIAAVGGLAWASVLYAKAEDNESNVTESKTLIQNIVIGLLVYVFLVALINWLVPGAVITP